MGYWENTFFAPEIEEVAQGSFKERSPAKIQSLGKTIDPNDEEALLAFHHSLPPIEGTGYVVKSLEAALWAFHHSDTFQEGCLLAVNLGDDADTTGAVYGQLAGAFYGEQGIPEVWRSRLTMRDLIETRAVQLLDMRGKEA